jgi:hypothetical protein
MPGTEAELFALTLAQLQAVIEFLKGELAEANVRQKELVNEIERLRKECGEREEEERERERQRVEELIVQALERSAESSQAIRDALSLL